MSYTDSPFYLLSPGDPIIENYRSIFESFQDPEIHTFSLTIHEDLVVSEDVAMPQNIILALQHYPDLIEKFLFSFNFYFTEIEDSELYIPESHWKQDPLYYKWFYSMMNLPFMLFFIEDADARFYALIGDILSKGEVQAEQPEKGDKAAVSLTVKQAGLLNERLFFSCLSLLIFCHGSNYNPVAYIQGILADFNAAFTYEDVFIKYEKDVKNKNFKVGIKTAK